jgi:hypothetical protein
MENKNETHDDYQKALDEINRKRTELQSSDLPYKMIAPLLEKLNEKEKALLLELDKLHKPKRTVFKNLVTGTTIIGGLAALGIILSKVLSDSDDLSDEDDEDEESFDDTESSSTHSNNDDASNEESSLG